MGNPLDIQSNALILKEQMGKTALATPTEHEAHGCAGWNTVCASIYNKRKRCARVGTSAVRARARAESGRHQEARRAERGCERAFQSCQCLMNNERVLFQDAALPPPTAKHQHKRRQTISTFTHKLLLKTSNGLHFDERQPLSREC